MDTHVRLVFTWDGPRAVVPSGRRLVRPHTAMATVRFEPRFKRGPPGRALFDTPTLIVTEHSRHCPGLEALHTVLPLIIERRHTWSPLPVLVELLPALSTLHIDLAPFVLDRSQTQPHSSSMLSVSAEET